MSSGQMQLVAKAVCANCNNGWMSRLEDSFQPVFSRLNSWERFTLTDSESDIAALWAVKTAAMFQQNDPETRTFSLEDLRGLRETGKPPPKTSVWMFAMDSAEDEFRLTQQGAHLGSPEDKIDAAFPASLGQTFLGAQRVAFVVVHGPHPLIDEEQLPVPGWRTARLLWPRLKPAKWPTLPAQHAEVNVLKLLPAAAFVPGALFLDE
ncbi:hypothetical protein [Subtercola boreus]|nr:hypothetical protein [Subtercola boreus]